MRSLDLARDPDPFDSAQGQPEPIERMSLSNGRHRHFPFLSRTAPGPPTSLTAPAATLTSPFRRTRRSLIIAGLPCAERPVSVQRLLGKQRAHLREMGNQFCVREPQEGCVLEEHRHVPCGTGRWHEFQSRLGGFLDEGTLFFRGHDEC